MFCVNLFSFSINFPWIKSNCTTYEKNDATEVQTQGNRMAVQRPTTDIYVPVSQGIVIIIIKTKSQLHFVFTFILNALAILNFFTGQRFFKFFGYLQMRLILKTIIFI
jgi:hypothetical protein